MIYNNSTLCFKRVIIYFKTLNEHWYNDVVIMRFSKCNKKKNCRYNNIFETANMQIVLVQSTNTQSMAANERSCNHGRRGESVANLSIFCNVASLPAHLCIW